MRTRSTLGQRTILRSFVLMLACIAFIFMTGPASAEGLFDKSAIALGRLEEGRTYQFPLELRNISQRTLNVEKVIASCGCTEVTFQSEPVPPGGILRLDLTIDTSGKKGSIVKVLDIYPSEATEPFELVLTADVTHPASTTLDAGVIFRGSCAACHVGSGVERKEGEALYNSVCYMCHKEPESFEEMDMSRLVETISGGKADTSMPGFLRSRGGPLDAWQVESLARYIKKASSISK